MQLAAPRALRQSIVIRTAVAISALVLLFVILAIWPLFMPRPTSASPIRPAIPTADPANYRIPSEPVDYNDPNYLGSYGG